MPFPPALALAASLAGAMLLAGCSSDATSPSGTPALSQADADAASDVLVADAADLSDGATSTSSAPTGADFSLTARGALGPWWSRLCSPAPTITTLNATTSYVFVECGISNPNRPLEAIVRNGEVDVTAQAGSRTVAFKDFSKEWIRIALTTGKPDTASATRNGTRETTSDGTTLTHKVYGLGDPASTDMQTDFVHVDHSTSQHLRNWNSSFAADVAGSIVNDEPLPSGTWTISGTGTWSHTPAGSGTTRSWTFVASTNDLHYNATCTTTPQFDAGTLSVNATNRQNGSTATFTITFTACGQYTTTITRAQSVG
ncbi:MAG TPA: hypothetical protein VFW66_07625 [Gemmatimonadales bacterium]|nr:hypothetical protein [Gemmatimonadales bacterium]